VINSRRLEGHTAVVVHVGSELARACAVRFAEEGATVLAVDPSESSLRAVASAVEQQGGRCITHQVGLEDESEIAAIAELCDGLWDSVSTLMVCAGTLDWWAEEDDSMARWQELLHLDLLLPVFYTKALAPALARSGHGSVIYYGSIDGLLGNPRLPAYSSARGGLIPFTHIAAHTYGDKGIRVNYIAGAAISPAGPEAPPNTRGPIWRAEEALEATPLARVATPDDIAGAALFLASSDSGYVTGSVLTVDGGRSTITPGTAL
jgi:NAD(P)-dependent dehydrogenase (short-subunit alcohol dehydrogenase family)